ncbi:transcription antitermination factor NusB [Paenibacillus sp. N1-5-1-14]|uniref:transcription antitermination factor NusB n=1 Tax=Paenibacillus radicibacter TaxID=2972488 RepID=UPI00215973C3|nr:transcription antitermination factor NusB [Paenibacillus radicibacter]MCR8642411.1 transcription antitermination factor NusB [Paenibacillus radicibacter]
MRRRVAREIALQSLYQMGMTEVTPKEAIEIALEEAGNDNEAGIELQDSNVSPQYVYELVEGSVRHRSNIDTMLSGYLKGWKMDRLSRIDREVLRLAAYEMLYTLDIPAKVVVNEAIELAKHFGTEESGKFVNGVLGQMIKDIDALRAKVEV